MPFCLFVFLCVPTCAFLEILSLNWEKNLLSSICKTFLLIPFSVASISHLFCFG